MLISLLEDTPSRNKKEWYHTVRSYLTRETKFNHSKASINCSPLTIYVIEQILTRGGKHLRACGLRTENPPCVLVSEAVSVLTKEHTLVLGGDDKAVSSSKLSLSCCEDKIRNRPFSYAKMIYQTLKHLSSHYLTSGSGSKVT